MTDDVALLMMRLNTGVFSCLWVYSFSGEQALVPNPTKKQYARY